MAYVNQQRKKELAPGIKAALKKYGYKGTIAVRHNSTLVINVRALDGAAPIVIDGPYVGDYERKYGTSINPYHYEKHYAPVVVEFLNELMAAANAGNHDNSDIMTDYFDVGWYVDVNLGPGVIDVQPSEEEAA